jgi:catechol 2,3-dioxygenase-like lactoylglutathione lyase family enzyme
MSTLANRPVYPILAASDLARARAWYAEKLGIEPVVEMDGTLVYRLGGGLLSIYASPNAGTARNTTAGWLVEDLRAAMSELRERGVRFEDYDIEGGPKTIDGISEDGSGGGTAWFTDSEGNVLMIVQPPPGFNLG